jgi:hypothetical protein
VTWKTRLIVFYLTAIGLYQGQLVTIRLDALGLVSRGGDDVVHYVRLLLVSSVALTLMACAALALIPRRRLAAWGIRVLFGSMVGLYLAHPLYALLIWQVSGPRMVDDGATVLLCLLQWTLWECWGRRFFGFSDSATPDR